MMGRYLFLAAVVLLGLSALPVQAAPPAASPTPPAKPTFEAHVRPILKAYCFECHGEEEKPKGKLDLRLTRFMLSGGKSGPAIIPGKSAESPLIERVVSGEMPPGMKKLSPAEIDVLKAWIDSGAKVERTEPATLAPGPTFTEDDRAWWAFQSIRRPAVPSGLAPHPVDAFLLAKLKEKGLGFNPEAERLALIRRVTWDLIGLPPTPEEVKAFLADSAPGAYERLVDRLLASPHYGERWARHWLDVAGYADSEGATPEDPVRVNAWKYRDYVIRSLNADKPFDQFLREQLAGDEMVKRPYANLSPADIDKLIATGFLQNAPDATATPGADNKTARSQVLADTVKIVSSSLLGLTVGCAQCHNHRYDPIPQADFYHLRSLFEPGFEPGSWKPPAARQLSLYTDADRAKAAAIEAEAQVIRDRIKQLSDCYITAVFHEELQKLPEEIRETARTAKETPAAKRTPEQKKLMERYPSLNVDSGSLYLYRPKVVEEFKAMNAEVAAIVAKKPVEEFIRVHTEEPGKVPVTHLYHRGDPDQPRQAIKPAGLSILADVHPLAVGPEPGLPTTGRRTAFARWITDSKNPLTARVLVNRFWMHHFGRGIVGSPGDFGRLGEKPTHPELLDWLASEFTQSGWSLKKFHRLVVTSTAYRQSSVRTPEKDRIDPDNRLLGRYTLRRLDAESVRDGMLMLSGALNRTTFGPPVPVMEDDVGQVILGKANRDGAGYKLGEEGLPADQLNRRSIYVQVRRTRPLAVLETFDWATVEPNCEARNSSTVTPQSLLLLNNDFVRKQSELFAARLMVDAGTDPAARVKRAWQLTYGCDPTPAQISTALTFLREQEVLLEAGASAGAGVAAAHIPRLAFQPRKTGKPGPLPPAAADRALAIFGQALLVSNRFLYVD